MSALMATTHLAKMLAFFWIGFELGAWLPLIVAMIAGGMLGNVIGERTLEHMREEWFRTGFKVVMSLLALRLMWTAAIEAKLV